eukprot:Pgem_evm1s18368
MVKRNIKHRYRWFVACLIQDENGAAKRKEKLPPRQLISETEAMKYFWAIEKKQHFNFGLLKLIQWGIV